MRAILYICHGSRVKSGQQAALAFIEKTMKSNAAPIQEACFLELAAPSIKEGVAACIAKGATEIIAVPFLLLRAGHANTDIPEELHDVMQDHPEIPLYYGDPIGVDERMVGVLAGRLSSITDHVSEDAEVLIIGRGSSDPATKEDFARIEEIFRKMTGIRNVSTGYLAACGPHYEDQLALLLDKKPRQLFILPYLLFTGILLKTVERSVRKLKTDTIVHLCGELGYDPVIREILIERALEAAERKCILDVPDHA